MFKPLGVQSKQAWSQPADIQCTQQQGSNHEVGSRWRTLQGYSYKKIDEDLEKERPAYRFPVRAVGTSTKDGHYPILGRSVG